MFQGLAKFMATVLVALAMLISAVSSGAARGVDTRALRHSAIAAHKNPARSAFDDTQTTTPFLVLEACVWPPAAAVDARDRSGVRAAVLSAHERLAPQRQAPPQAFVLRI